MKVQRCLMIDRAAWDIFVDHASVAGTTPGDLVHSLVAELSYDDDAPVYVRARRLTMKARRRTDG